jgi:predicted site-specific integrase-resolvase
MSPKPEILKPSEAARELDVSVRTLARYRAEGRIPYVQYSSRLIRYLRQDIEKFREQSYRINPPYDL